MTDILLGREIEDFLTVASVAEVTAVITSVHGNLVTLDTNVSPLGNEWQYKVLEVTSGDAVMLYQVIVHSAGNQLTLSSPFYSVKPVAGDTVRLWAGPLAQARIYKDEPDSVKEAIAQGVEYFVSVCVLTGDQTMEGLGGRVIHGAQAAVREFGVTVILEGKHVMGNPTAEELFRSVYAIAILKEQVLAMLYAFRASEVLSQNNNDPISWVKVLTRRPGYESPLKGYKLDMDIRLK